MREIRIVFFWADADRRCLKTGFVRRAGSRSLAQTLHRQLLNTSPRSGAETLFSLTYERLYLCRQMLFACMRFVWPLKALDNHITCSGQIHVKNSHSRLTYGICPYHERWEFSWSYKKYIVSQCAETRLYSALHENVQTKMWYTK